MCDIGKWLDSIGAPRCDERGWAYTEIGRIEAYIEEGKQSLEQRLIDVVNDKEDDWFCFECGGRTHEFIELIEKVFSDKQI